ncbi:cytochrome c biogenesis protein DipZ [Spirochaeta cellobiosiphila]|uniref:cytochrome c biogenesis protein DipZ n=1 Tax=Spirochaeta cellobiosiphila TaxID=504483 RepID=UPI0004188A79|nr:cytochrome c biogenesis protein DipZ [Spirochaeta cellobiosiphila]
MIILSFFAFLSGIVTILSPCILPVLPLVLSGSVGGKRKPIGVIIGFILSFSFFTLLLSTLVQTLNIPPEALRWVAIAIIFIFGIMLIFPTILGVFETFLSRIIKIKPQSKSQGLGGGILLGSSLGLIWTPCVGPIMASVISLAISQQVKGSSIVLIIAYALGTSIPMIAIMLGGRKLINALPFIKHSASSIQRVFGVIMIFLALAIGLGWDRQFQSYVLNKFPQYGTGLTSFENTKIVQKELNKQRESTSSLSWQNPPQGGLLGQYGSAPDFISNSTWLNSEPLDWDSLKGKVVLIDFWTYSCINCVRTIPHLQNWYDKYKDQGLVIIGVHAPEFAFERNRNNVMTAMEELGVTWPVVQDNNFQLWNDYNNRFWPAHYFVDARGQIRYYHFGEGGTETSEKVIQKLLKEAGYSVKESIDKETKNTKSRITKETYLGYGRADAYKGSIITQEEQKTYQPDSTLQEGEWTLEGSWTVRKDFIETEGDSQIKLSFTAKNVYMVVDPLEEEPSITITIDGSEQTSTLEPTESKLYQLVQLDKTGSHILTLTIKGKVRFYTFTFG